MNPNDPDVIALSKAIFQHESGGNFNAVGDAGTSHGAGQWQAATWKAQAKDVLGDENAQMTPQNQKAVTQVSIAKDKASGLNPAQIAAKWNSGSPDGWENKIGTTTINGQQIHYDVPAYVKAVTDLYQKNKTSGASGLTSPLPQAPSAPTPAQTPADQSGGVGGGILHGLGSFAKSIVSPVATLLARPLQAGAELLGANSADVDRVSNDLSGGLVAPVPQNFGDVKKDIGRGAETVALGLGPVAGGAAFGAGNSLEQGNNLFSGQTALQTGTGAVGGKLLDLAAPFLAKTASAVVPKVAKDLSSKVGGIIAPAGQAVKDFADKTQILPKGVSDFVNKTAGTVSAVPGVVGKTVANQYGFGAGQTRRNALDAVSKALGESGKKSAGVFAKANEAKLTGLENMADNAGQVKFSDGESYDPTTATLHQHVDALNQLKQQAYNAWQKEVEQATGAGIQVDTQPTIDALQKIIDSPGSVRHAPQAQRVIGEIKALQGNPSELQAYLQTLNSGLKGVFSGGSATAERDVDALAVKSLTDALDRSVIDIGKDSLPIRQAKDLYSSYKAVEDGLVKKAQQAARKSDGGMGGGLYDYINPFNVADFFTALSHPIGAAKAGIRMALLAKAKAAKDPEKILQGIFQTINGYKGLGTSMINSGKLQLLKNSAIGGGIKTAFPQKEQTQ